MNARRRVVLRSPPAVLPRCPKTLAGWRRACFLHLFTLRWWAVIDSTLEPSVTNGLGRLSDGGDGVLRPRRGVDRRRTTLRTFFRSGITPRRRGGRRAREANPLIALVLDQYPKLFALTKMGLTGGGVLVLVAMARARVFNVMRASSLLHAVLAGYLTLIAYEWWLLRAIV